MNSNSQKIIELSLMLQQLKENDDSCALFSFLKSFNEASLSSLDKKLIIEQAVDLNSTTVVNSLLDAGAPYTEKVRFFIREARLDEAAPTWRSTLPLSTPPYPMRDDPGEEKPMTIDQRVDYHRSRRPENIVKQHGSQQRLDKQGSGGAEDPGSLTPEEETKWLNAVRSGHRSRVTLGQAERHFRAAAGEHRQTHTQKTGWNKNLDPALVDREGYTATRDEIEAFELLIRLVENKLTSRDIADAGISRQKPSEHDNHHATNIANKEKRVALFDKVLDQLSAEKKAARFSYKDEGKTKNKGEDDSKSKKKGVYPEFIPKRQSSLNRVLSLEEARLVNSVALKADHPGFLKSLLKHLGRAATGSNNPKVIDAFPTAHTVIPMQRADLLSRKNGYSLISVVMMRDDSLTLDLLDQLLKKGADPNDDEGLPLLQALKSDNDEAAISLIEHGAAVTLTDELLTAFLSCENEKVLNLGLQDIADDPIDERILCQTIQATKGGRYAVPTRILERLFKSKGFHWTKIINRKATKKESRKDSSSILFTAIDREDPELFEMILYPGGINNFWSEPSIISALNYARDSKIKSISAILEKAKEEKHFFSLATKDAIGDQEIEDPFKDTTPISDVYLSSLILQSRPRKISSSEILKQISSRKLVFEPNPGSPGHEKIRGEIASKRSENLPVKSAIYAAVIRGDRSILEAILEPNGVSDFWSEYTLRQAIRYRTEILDEDNEDPENDEIIQTLKAKLDLDKEQAEQEEQAKKAQVGSRIGLPSSVQQDIENEERIKSQLKKAEREKLIGDKISTDFKGSSPHKGSLGDERYTPASKVKQKIIIPLHTKSSITFGEKNMQDIMKRFTDAIDSDSVERVRVAYEVVLNNFDHALEDLRTTQTDLSFKIDEALNTLRTAGFNPPNLNHSNAVENAIEMCSRIRNILNSDDLKKLIKAKEDRDDALRLKAKLESHDRELKQQIDAAVSQRPYVSDFQKGILQSLQDVVKYAQKSLDEARTGKDKLSAEDSDLWTKLSARARELHDQLNHLKTVDDEYFQKTRRRIKDPDHVSKKEAIEKEYEEVSEKITKLHASNKEVQNKAQKIDSLTKILNNLQGYLRKFESWSPRELQ